jgi:pimeloyl-ACP methyl ester carboxylesterase
MISALLLAACSRVVAPEETPTDGHRAADRAAPEALLREALIAETPTGRRDEPPATTPEGDDADDGVVEVGERSWLVPIPQPPVELPEHAPALLLHLTPGAQDAPLLPRVVFLHGYSACVRALSATGPTSCVEGLPPREGWGLAAAADDSGRALALLFPQLAFLRRDGTPGRLNQPGEARRTLEAALARGFRGAQGGAPPSGPWILVAHSGGFMAAAAIAEHGDMEIDAIVLLDALYGAAPLFARWLGRHPDAQLVSLHRPTGEPAHMTRLLTRRLRRELGEDAVASTTLDNLREVLRTRRFVSVEVQTAHAEIPTRHLASILSALLSPSTP